MSRILIQYDGSNFYNKVKGLVPGCHLTRFNYQGLSDHISAGSPAITSYYVGEVRRKVGNAKSNILYANQQSLFHHLRTQNIKIKLGYLLESNGKYHEKGVDVRIAVDLAVGAVKNQYDECYLLSSDTDLIPAIKVAQSEGKKVIYVGFENAVSVAMKNTCSSTTILGKSDLASFFPK